MPLRETHTRKNLSDEAELAVVKDIAETKMNFTRIAEKHGISSSTVGRINGDWEPIPNQEGKYRKVEKAA